MLTDNFRRFMRTNSGTFSRDTDSTWSGNGTNIDFFTNIQVKAFDSSTTGYSANYYLNVGSGSTTPTASDVCLDTIITDLTYVSGSISNGSGTLIKHIDTTYKNNTESAITVREFDVGFQYRVSSNSNSYSVILAREVLDTPVVIMPGKSYTFAWELNM